MKILVLVIALFIGQQSLAGDLSDTLYLDKYYRIVEKRDNWELIRIVSSTMKNKTFGVVDFMRDGAVFFEGNVGYLNSDFPIGKHKFYYPNGQIKIEGEMLGGNRFKGYAEKIWYSNGNIMCAIKSEGDQLLFLEASDSIGNRTLKNGNGIAEHEVFYAGVIWKGKVSNQKKDSLWLCVDADTRRLQFTEYFAGGKLLRGVAFFLGDTIEYNEVFTHTVVEQIKTLEKQFKQFLTEKVKKPKGSRLTFELLVQNGRIVHIKQMLKKKDEFRIDIRDFKIPDDFLLLERGVPAKFMKISLNV